MDEMSWSDDYLDKYLESVKSQTYWEQNQVKDIKRSLKFTGIARLTDITNVF